MNFSDSPAQNTCKSHLITPSALTDLARLFSLYWEEPQPTEARETKMDVWETQY